MVETDDLIKKDKSLILLLRFRNCTGNIIKLDNKPVKEVDAVEKLRAEMTLQVDNAFLHTRHRKIKQTVDMVLRWRTIATGYFDYQIKRFVEGMPFEQAAKNLALRHEIVTGQDQVIKKTTLEEYFFLIN